MAPEYRRFVSMFFFFFFFFFYLCWDSTAKYHLLEYVPVRLNVWWTRRAIQTLEWPNSLKCTIKHLEVYRCRQPIVCHKWIKFISLRFFTKTASASLSIVILDYRLPQYSFYPFNAFIHQSFDFRGCKSDSDHFPSCTCISMSFMRLCIPKLPTKCQILTLIRDWCQISFWYNFP